VAALAIVQTLPAAFNNFYGQRARDFPLVFGDLENTHFFSGRESQERKSARPYRGGPLGRGHSKQAVIRVGVVHSVRMTHSVSGSNCVQGFPLT